MQDSKALEDLLLRGLDDWVDAAELAWVVNENMGATTDAEVREGSLRLLETVLRDGLMRIGNVTAHGFEPLDMPASQALQRVRSAWEALGRRPQIGELFWLDNTSAGDIKAQRAREEQT